jgi:hypothetical protein
VSLATFAFRAATKRFGFSRDEAEKLIGVDMDTAFTQGLSVTTPEGQRAFSFLIINRILKTYVDNNMEGRLHWLETENKAFGMSPKQRMLKNPNEGIQDVRDYLEYWESTP